MCTALVIGPERLVPSLIDGTFKIFRGMTRGSDHCQDTDVYCTSQKYFDACRHFKPWLILYELLSFIVKQMICFAH